MALQLRIVLLATLALALNSSCQVDGYCVDCIDAKVVVGDGDGGLGDGGPNVLQDGDTGDAVFADACVPTGVEVCDGFDNDCDGVIDGDDVPEVGVACGSDIGLCVAGTTVCQEGVIRCGGTAVAPTLELCNGEDDDCDGVIDEDNPEGGVLCGTNLGECVAGTQTCVDGVIECVGQVTGSPETCNGLDDDCDGLFDEDVPTDGDCGPASNAGECVVGTMTCIGGSMQCVGAVLPSAEQCDALDRDCDGNPTNGFDLTSDAKNCSACGVVCDAPNAFTACNASQCVIANCASGYFDNNNVYGDGCEFGPCTFRGNEICNGIDDDCDGETDEGLDANPPAVCDQDGECATSVATCQNGAWVCSYGPTVSKDGTGAIVPENNCDGLDNDCDGHVDEAFPTLGSVCDDGELGECRDVGVIACNGTQDGVVCTAVDDDGTPPAEVCDGLDNDCDGDVDEGDLQEWVDIGSVEMFKYEASRPDSTNTEQGFVLDGAVCSSPNRLPWTNITQPEAQAACDRIGARLCTEAEWQRGCETRNLATAEQNGTNGLIVFEAEDASLFVRTSGQGEDWTVTTDYQGASGGAALAVPNGSVGDETNPGNLNGAPRVDYPLTFTETGTHYLWVRLWAPNGNSDSMWAAFDDTDYNLAGNPLVDLDSEDFDSWRWVNFFNDGSIMSANVASAGVHTLSFYHREDGLVVDRVVITTDANFVPLNEGPPAQCGWSYGTDCRVYQPNTCNGDNYDTDPGTPGDQDELLATGSMAACYADWPMGRVYDLSGNAKEWTAARAADINPIRGGSFNNTAVGTSCQFDFLTAPDDFFLPNIGFRCCR